MRKLLIVLLVFVLSIISLILVFNTFINTSKQSKIQLVQELPQYPNAPKRLAQALRIPTIPDSNLTANFSRFQALIQKNYPAIFNNPNVEWQYFEQFSWVAKWVGRTSELAPIVLVAEQYVEEPELKHIPEWSYNPFMGKIDQEFVYGQGAQNGKAAMLAMLEVFNTLVRQNTLPERTIYFAFPHNTQQGEKAIIQALQSAQIAPEFILKTGGLISQNILWDLTMPMALIGVGRQSVAQITLEAKNSTAKPIIQAVQQLKAALPLVEMEAASINDFLTYISPEMPFGQRLIFSNQWLLNNIQQKQLQNNSLTKAIFGHNITSHLTPQDSNKTSLGTVTLTGSNLNHNLEQWVKSHLQHPKVQLLGQAQFLYKNQKRAAINNGAYRLISNTCKEIFPHIISAPILVNKTSKVNWQANLNTDIYYFHPVIYTPTRWEKAQKKIDNKINIKNYEQMMQFYYQLIMNSI
ncbi:M20/M25/M40 family metallo-hydrolase [Aureispira anguillae]|uniref:M20/M25/M40 family metallo-hydrolase n=1 Tax=Aureispira anguillae TaxID=2864201 RepID=A0A915YIJ7_9BACT|nr:M20/M25/M40 family metallo-hydrolase [Aureispira anguillae]BDS13850.1 M20/M25/M40 family metallo-hydrolase [Aureispira anguillae]